MIDSVKKIFVDPKGGIKQMWHDHPSTSYFIIALFLDLILETISRKSLFKAIFFAIGSPYIFILNVFIIFMTFSLSLLFRRRAFAISLVSIIWIILSAINAILQINRVTPFSYDDFRLIGNGLKIMHNYFNPFQIFLIFAGLVLFIAIAVVLFFVMPKRKDKIEYLKATGAIAIIIVTGIVLIMLGTASNLIPKKFGNLNNAYNQYGFVYCFSSSVVNRGIKKPKNYSEEGINGIVEETSRYEEEVDDKNAKRPNIIFLQLESFFDVNYMKNLKFSKNPLPVFTKLKEENPKGYLNVPVVGAGTVNTEFEAITGMNVEDFGQGEYPYTTVLSERGCESICYNLKKHGYTSTAIHNNVASFYGRNKVFSNLGFDNFISIENMYIREFTPMGWAKDKFLTENILETLDSTEGKDFIYTISVQGHGSYPGDGEFNYPIYVSGIEDETLTNQFQYYCWQISEMDTFVGDLIDKLNKRKEDTVLVLYGDHLPSLGITSDDLLNGDVYQTEYVIWTNTDIDYTSEMLEAYELEPKVLKLLGITTGEINNYSQKNRNGKSKDDYLEGLHTLAYDQLYGDNLSLKDNMPYTPTELKFGLHDVKVSSVSPVYDGDGSVYIYGDNFTVYSKVYVNGEYTDTIYIDKNSLMIKYKDITYGDEFYVCQQDADRNILNTSNPVKYMADEIPPETIKEPKE